MIFCLRLMVLCAVLILAACDGKAVSSDSNHVSSTVQTTKQSVAAGTEARSPGSLAAHDPAQVEQTVKDLQDSLEFNIFKDPWTGDLDSMIERRLIRVLTVYGPPRYFLAEGQEKGMTFEMFQQFQKHINTKEGRKNLKVHVVLVPVARDQLIPALLNGRGDIVAAGLTITPEREESVAFSDPLASNISEILVTGPTATPLGSIEDLSGKEVYVRASSSYRSSLDALNARLRSQGSEEVMVEDANELLEDDDILEMVNAGLLPWAIVDDYKAEMWASVFKNLTVRNDLVFRTGGEIGFAFRKDSPEFAAALNEFAKTHRAGTLSGNILINRYVKADNWAKNALAEEDYERFQSVLDVFAKYGAKYGVDYLMVAAQGYQESRLNQQARSKAGAIGIMQLLPSTAADPNVGIPDISTADANIHAGVKYINFIRDRYFSESEMDRFNQTMFAFASYNAGPARINGLREKAADQGYDSDLWFDNVEVIAARDIGHETVAYVANILKYYVAYSMTVKQQLKREQARQQATAE